MQPNPACYFLARRPRTVKSPTVNMPPLEGGVDDNKRLIQETLHIVNFGNDVFQASNMLSGGANTIFRLFVRKMFLTRKHTHI